MRSTAITNGRKGVTYVNQPHTLTKFASDRMSLIAKVRVRESEREGVMVKGARAETTVGSGVELCGL